MPMQELLLLTAIPMDAACRYVNGDDTADEQFFAGTIPYVFCRWQGLLFSLCRGITHARFPGFAS